MSNWKILHGDNRSIMPTLPAASFDAVVCDPPYELGFMGKKWDSSGIAYDVEMWRASFLLLKPGAHLVAFGGTRTYHRLASAIEDAGFEIRDQLAWVFGSGFPKSHNLKGEHEGWGTALKPAWEPIVLARKPLAGTVAANVAAHGTGALHIGACRIESEITTGWGGAMGGSADPSQSKGRNYRMAAGESRPVEGRWPANLCHDGSPEVVDLFPESQGAQGAVTGEEPSSASGGTRCFGSMERTGNSVPRSDFGSAARFFYCAKASAADREAGLAEAGLAEAITSDGRETPIDNAYLRGETKRLNTHPTVKPTELMRWLVRLVTPVGGHVIDPFSGSGSTGVACICEGMNYTGIEREAEYVKISRARLTEAAGPLFAEANA